MTAVTLSGKDPVVTLTLDADAAGGQVFIGSNSCKKEAVLTPMPFYSLDSDQTDVFDFGGTIKTITLSGVFIGTSVSDIKTNFIDVLEGFIQGHQDIPAGYPLTFSDADTRGTIKVKVADLETVKESGSPLICRWNMRLLQSSLNS